jgi:hypothetical protein
MFHPRNNPRSSLKPRASVLLAIWMLECSYNVGRVYAGRCCAALHRRPTELSEKNPRRTVSPKQLLFCGLAQRSESVTVVFQTAAEQYITINIQASLACKFLAAVALRYGGDGGIRILVGGFGPQSGLANCPIPHAVVRNQWVTFGHDAPFLCKEPLFGVFVQLFRSHS